MKSADREKAAAILAHYFGIAKGGRDEGALSPDCRLEIRQIIDHVVEAAKEEIRAELGQERKENFLNQVQAELGKSKPEAKRR